LKIGTTAACFHNEGNFPVDKLRLKMWCKRGIKYQNTFLIIKLGISSEPTDCFERRWPIAHQNHIYTERLKDKNKCAQSSTELFGDKKSKKQRMIIIIRHDKVCTHLHYSICKKLGTETAENWYSHITKPVNKHKDIVTYWIFLGNKPMHPVAFP
jgi:hypothetical protein